MLGTLISHACEQLFTMTTRTFCEPPAWKPEAFPVWQNDMRATNITMAHSRTKSSSCHVTEGRLDCNMVLNKHLRNTLPSYRRNELFMAWLLCWNRMRGACLGALAIVNLSALCWHKTPNCALDFSLPWTSVLIKTITCSTLSHTHTCTQSSKYTQPQSKALLFQ